MLQTLIGTKIQQTQMFTDAGVRIPVTDIATGNTVVQIKTDKRDGYWAIQLGFGARKAKTTSKPLTGHLKKTGKGNLLPRFLREARVVSVKGEGEKLPFAVEDMISAEQVFKVGDTVKVSGISKGKGFQGVVKRHGFRGGPRTHGQSDRERAPGSIGQTTTPGRVYKGKRMAGRMGGERVTIRGLKVIHVDPQKNVVRIKGLIPGRIHTLVIIEKQEK